MAPRRPPTAHIHVLEQLREAIVRGELRPSDQIFADEIAERLGMSRIPVREALRILEGEGQVVYEPHRGYFIAPLTLGDLLELYHIRQVLESEALRLTVPELDDEEITRMEASCEEMRQTHAAGDVQRHVAANRRFHFAFWERSAMPRLRRMLVQLYDSCDAYGSLYFNDAGNRRRTEREHRALLAAAKARDAERVVALLAAHRQHVVDALRGPLADSEEAEATGAETGATPPRRRRRPVASDAAT